MLLVQGRNGWKHTFGRFLFDDDDDDNNDNNDDDDDVVVGTEGKNLLYRHRQTGKAKELDF